MEPYCSVNLYGRIIAVHGFDYDRVWAKARKLIAAGWTLLASEHTQLEHKRTHRRGVFTELLLQL